MAIVIDHLNHIYSAGTAYEKQALKDINLTIPDGQFIGLIGHTGSGKSTLIQHLNGLIKATSGTIYYNGRDIYDEDYGHKYEVIWDDWKNETGMTGTICYAKQNENEKYSVSCGTGP